MVSIQGLPPSRIPGTGKSSKTSKAKRQNAQSEASSGTYEPTPVANAVAHSMRSVKDAERFQENLQYDLPEGRARKALEEYFGVMNQARREELAQMLGVDIYI
ncbi:chromosome partitioning protein ParA [Vibrio mangrovi]|uniref:Chromosome partitioning protein ParA n=1 Tax=Vibrio mangrovi TaxID=474394 RepID=A0A1Y6IPM1_9VIBR|nr:chromosome partitioning protein ParA [Vibrio mangrovi]MDW6003611.1 chromosome partitioning protein ParA [Vibrio mangrovi]SMR99597.1 hypothetical protein VIM7927_00824 [Vibrio mangrovi]